MTDLLQRFVVDEAGRIFWKVKLATLNLLSELPVEGRHGQRGCIFPECIFGSWLPSRAGRLTFSRPRDVAGKAREPDSTS